MKIYDVETQKLANEVEGEWNNLFGMLFGSAVVYDSILDRYFFYGPDDRKKLIGDLSGNLVVSFNGIRFDNGVVLGNNWREKEPIWVDLDIKQEITKKWKGVSCIEEAENLYGRAIVHSPVSLDKICKKTLGHGKSGHGEDAPKLIKEGKWKELYEYNLEDVRLTKKLTQFIMNNHYCVIGSGKRVEIKIPKRFWQI